MSRASSRSLRLRYAASLSVLLIAVAACSTSKQNTTAGGGGGGGTNCATSAAQRQFAQTWKSAFTDIGLKPAPMPNQKICDVNTSKWAKKPTNGKYTIAFAAQGPTNSWAVEDEEAFKLRAQQLGVHELYASADGDATKQVDNIQQLAAQSPDAMVVVPLGSGIIGELKQAEQQGIPVVLCAGVLNGSGAVSTVVRSYDLQATVWADWVVKQLHGKGDIAMLSGIPGVPTAELQKAAAEKVFAKHPGIHIVTKQYTDWSPTKAKTVAQNLLTQYPHLDAIWSDSAISDLGVFEAYQQAGKPVPPLTGDSSNAFLKAVQGKPVRFALSSFPPEQSVTCLNTAMDILKGKTVPSFVNIKSAVYTNADASKIVRPNCSDNLWVPSSLPDAVLKKLKLC